MAQSFLFLGIPRFFNFSSVISIFYLIFLFHEIARLFSQEQFKELRYHNMSNIRLAKGSKAATHLRKHFEEGKNDGSEYPKAVLRDGRLVQGAKTREFTNTLQQYTKGS